MQRAMGAQTGEMKVGMATGNCQWGNRRLVTKEKLKQMGAATDKGDGQQEATRGGDGDG